MEKLDTTEGWMMTIDPEMPTGLSFVAFVEHVRQHEPPYRRFGAIGWKAPGLVDLSLDLFPLNINDPNDWRLDSARFEYGEGDKFLISMSEPDLFEHDDYAEFVLDTVVGLYNRHCHNEVCLRGQKPVGNPLKRLIAATTGDIIEP